MGPSFFQRFVVASIATVAGIYVVKEVGKDLAFVTFTPHSEEEVERRKRDHIGMSMHPGDTMSLDYKPEAKERFRRYAEEQKSKEKEIDIRH